MPIPTCAKLGLICGGRRRDRKRSTKREKESQEDCADANELGTHDGARLKRLDRILAWIEAVQPRERAPSRSRLEFAERGANPGTLLLAEEKGTFGLSARGIESALQVGAQGERIGFSPPQRVNR